MPADGLGVGLPTAHRLSLLVGATLLVVAIAAPAAPASSSGPGGGDSPASGEEPSSAPASNALEPALPAASAATELAPIEQATAELGRAKREAGGALARLRPRSTTVLRPCLRGGPGWSRIRRVRHRPQRALYTFAARRLLADMRALLDEQQPRIAAHAGAFGRFVERLRDAPISSPLLREAIAAQARRLAAYADVGALEASCAVFNRLAGRVREFPTRTAAQIVRADYRATPVARRIERYVSDRLRAIDRRHGISYGDVGTLERAAELIVGLGGSPGYATGFQYALSLR